MLDLIIILSVILVIAFGYKSGFNTGFFGIICAFIIGCFIMDMSVSQVIAKWPTSIFFVFFAVAMFFGFASNNGTLEKVSRKMMYACRNVPFLIPYALFFAGTLLTAMGVSVMGAIAFMAPIGLALCEELKLDKFIGSIICSSGVCAGADFITGGNGIIWLGLFDQLGLSDQATKLCLSTFFAAVIFFILFFTIYMICTKSFSKFAASTKSLTKPEPFTKPQRQTLVLICILLVAILVIPILSTLIGGEFLTELKSNMNIGMVAIILSVVSLFLKLADQKSVIAKVPWNTLLMISGVGMLIGVAVEAGTIEHVGSWIGTALPKPVVPLATSLVSSFMSFFASTGGVVGPTLFPMVPAMAETSGIGVGLLFNVIVVGAQASAISPFSTCGSLILAACDNDEDRERLYKKFIFVAVPLTVASAAVYNLIMSLIL